MENNTENPDSGHKKGSHTSELKENMIKRLSRIEGQIRGISKMIENDEYCDNVLHQISSVGQALNGVKTVLLDAHLKSCVIEQIKDGKDEVVDELLVTLRKFLK